MEWTPVSIAVASNLDPQSGRRDYSRWASKSLYKRNLDAAPARKWRPFRPTPPNLDAAPTPNRRPNQQPPRIWTPRRHPTGVQINNHQESGRHFDTQQASKSATTKNLDATPTTHRRPIRHTPPNLDATPTAHWRPFRLRFPI